MTESGGFVVTIDAVTDAKSLYDVCTLPTEPTPADQTAFLWLKWLREKLEFKVLRALCWCCAEDMVADGLTKKIKQDAIISLMKGQFKTKFSVLRMGQLLDAWKGLPLPKNQAKECCAHFIQQIVSVLAVASRNRDVQQYFLTSH